MPDDEDEEEENDAEEDCEEAAGSAEGAGRAGKADESTGEPAEPQGSAKDDSDAIHRRPAEVRGADPSFSPLSTVASSRIALARPTVRRPFHLYVSAAAAGPLSFVSP